MKIIVGFDLREKLIKVMIIGKTKDKTVSTETEYLHFNERIFTGEFYAEARAILQEYFATKPLLANQPVYVVLPNEAVGFEMFNLPNLSQSKLDQAFETELSNQFEGRQKEKKINKFPVSHNKQYTIIGAVYFDKMLVNNVYKMLTGYKLFPKQTTYSANGLLNAVLANMPKARGKSFVFADVHGTYTEIVISSKGKTMGFAYIPHGTDLLKTDKVESEYMRTEHTAGEIAVINARESAKAKALTTIGTELPEDATFEDYAVDGAAEGEYSGERAEQAAQDEVTEAVPEETAEAGAEEAAEEIALDSAAAETAGEGAAEGTDDAEDEEKALEEAAKARLNKIKVYRKMPKRYPKFMLRELPETEEGFLFENFRILAKWILLYARQAELSEYISSPEFILVNMPEDRRFLLEKMNEEQGDGLQFKAFTAADKLAPQQRNNLALTGCLFAKQYNKNHNF